MSDRFKKKLDNMGFSFDIIEFNQSTKTAQDAANALNCQIGQIVKSLVFKCINCGKPIIFLVSGSNKLDDKKVSETIGKKIEKANADFVKIYTGFSIGGVPPIGYEMNIEIYMDKDLLNFDEVWAAAGTPNSVFKINSKTLLEITKAKIISVN